MTEQKIKILPDSEVYDRYEINTSIEDYRQLVELVIKRNIVANDFLKALRRVMPYLEIVPQWLIDADTEITQMRDMTLNTITIWKIQGVVKEKEGYTHTEEKEVKTNGCCKTCGYAIVKNIDDKPIVPFCTLYRYFMPEDGGCRHYEGREE